MSEPYLERMLRQLPVGVWATNRELRVTQAHGPIVATLTAAGRQVIGTTIGELVGSHEDAADESVRRHLAALAGEPQAYRSHVFERWWEVRIEPLRGEQDRIEGCVGCAFDFTEQKASEDAASKAVSLLEATLDATADGILVIGRDGRVRANSQRFVAMWRIPDSLLTSQNDGALLAFVSEQLEDPDAFLRGVRDLYERPEVDSFDVLRFKDGRVFERCSKPQRIGDSIEGRVWSVPDVTERERLLRRAEFLASAGRLLVSLDAEIAFASVAQLAMPYLGDACAVDLCADPTERDPGVTSPRRVVALARPGAAPVREGIPGEVCRGQPFIEWTGSASTISAPLVIHGNVVGAITFTATRRHTKEDLEVLAEVARPASLSLANARLYQRERAALAARDDFISVAAHELRGPVTSIHLAAQTLRKGKVSTEISPKLLDIIEREDRRLEGLVNELLDVARIRGGSLHLTLQNVELADVTREVMARFALEASQAGSALSVDCTGSSAGVWDRLRLDQVVTNLVSNAIKFGRGKPIELTIRSDDQTHTTILTVRDHGIGISLDQQAKLFHPFERAVSVRHYGGLGLGLYIVRTIVEGLGGRVHLESKVGEGTTFTVELPRRKEESWQKTATC